MRTWTRASQLAVCGGCVRFIEKDAPIQIIAIPGVNRTRIRCEQCADDSPPANLPALPVRSFDTTSEMTHVAKLAKALPFDWKTAQIGDKD